MKRSRIIYIYSEQPDYIRADKVLSMLDETDQEIFYIGCTRGNQPARKISHKQNISYCVSKLSIPHGGIFSAFFTFMFMIYSLYKAFIIKPDLIIAVNEELALPFVLFFPKTLKICEAYDTLAMRHKVENKFLGRLLENVSKFVLSRCNGLVEVSKERLDFHRNKPKKIIVVPNSPRRINFSDEVKLSPALTDLIEKKDFIFVSGSFSDRINGLEELLKALDVCKTRPRIIAAGRPNGSWVEDVFLKHPSVSFIGTVKPAEASFIASQSKGIFAYYKPISLLYEYAAPNKIFDAMSVGIPVLINDDCQASKFGKQYSFALTSDYDDYINLSKNLDSLMQADNLINGTELKSTFQKKYEWSVVSGIYKDLVYSFLDHGGSKV